MIGSKKANKTSTIETLISNGTEVQGDVSFDGGMRVDGTIRGNVSSAESNTAVLILGEQGKIEGNINVPNLVVNGTIIGSIRSTHNIDIDSSARITGDIYYKTIEMAVGAEVNGQLLHIDQIENENLHVIPLHEKKLIDQ